MLRNIFITTSLFLGSIALGQSFKDKTLISGNEYFWTFVCTAGNPSSYDMSSREKVYMLNESSSEFVPIMDHLVGVCVAVHSNPLGNVLAMITTVEIPDKIGGDHVLVVADSSGHTIRKIQNVFVFTWLTDDKIAYLSGNYSETNEKGGFNPSGTWILEISTDRKTKVLDAGYSLFFDQHQSIVYIDTYQEVYAYDLSKSKLSKTAFRGNKFSPSGKYYFRDPSVYRSFMMYETQTNNPVEADSLISEGSDVQKRVQFARWFDDENDYLMLGNQGTENKIIDVKNAKLLKTFSGKILGVDVSKREAIVVNKKAADATGKRVVERMRVF